MGFARKMKKKNGQDFISTILNDEHFCRAMEFDQDAIEMLENEKRVCRRDGQSLKVIRSVSMTAWPGHQDQLVCSSCSKKYVQFVPDGERDN